MNDQQKTMANWFPTTLSTNRNVEDWPATAHMAQSDGSLGRCNDHEVPTATIRLRRIGWLDQAGNVWINEADWRKAGGPNGSITPLLINPGCD
jgi:hypothetical protein